MTIMKYYSNNLEIRCYVCKKEDQIIAHDVYDDENYLIYFVCRNCTMESINQHYLHHIGTLEIQKKESDE